MNYYNEKFAQVDYDDVNRVVITIFKGYMTSEQLREVYNKNLECVLKYRAAKVLADFRNFVTVRAEDQQWLTNNYLPRAKNANIRKTASLVPENMIQKQVINKLAEQAEQVISGKEYKTFSNYAEALAWLKK